jgi:DnaK suppressor protein
METYEIKDGPRFGLLLSQREQEIRAELRALDNLTSTVESTAGHEVLDFKDVAVEETLARLDRANAHRLEIELSQVMSAQRRLFEHRYGKCQECGELINLQRLLALPASAYCTACQTTLEHEKFPHPQAL